ncbi:MAG: hypothetical protein GXO21_03130, partial [Aquificae bacterium]|nr:hypothetical protein [Aquificota bacterium]
KEIKKRLETLNKEFSPQLSLFSEDKLEQFNEDKELLKHRLQYLQKEEKKELNRIDEKYNLEKLHIFPLGLLYLIPESMLEE